MSPTELKEGRYAVVRTLAEGAQASTLEAVDKQRGRLVAIKRFSIRGARSWKDVELAEREARVLASLEHPQLPAYVDHFEEDGVLYLVMEKIEGESLQEIRRRGARLDEDEVWRLLADAALVLRYLHGRAPPVIHRDVKPANVIRRPDGSFALVDFGAVRDSLKPEGGSTVVGTFGYMAPEQFQGRALAATDVYGVGATALALLTGAEPESLPHRGLAIDVRAALGGRDQPIVRVLSAMLDPDPDRRASSIEPLLEKHRRARERSRDRRPRRERTQERASQGVPLPALIALLVVVAVALARVAVAVSLRFALPVLLALLGLLIPGLIRWARTVRKAGGRADEALRSARRRVVDRAPPPTGDVVDTSGVDVTEAPRRPERRARVVADEPPAGSPLEADAELDDDAEPPAEPGPRTRVRRRDRP